MESTHLMRAMIEQCQEMIELHDTPVPTPDWPGPLRPGHLLWMCGHLNEHVDDWSEAKMNRWIGFIQCAMIANGIVDLEEAKAMFDNAKNAFGEPSQDLLDHLDVHSNFNLDIGGQG